MKEDHIRRVLVCVYQTGGGVGDGGVDGEWTLRGVCTAP